MRYGNDRGFSLVEVLVVAAIMGMVMMAVFGLYQSTQRSSSTQDEVVEVQQNLRIAMEQIARDLRMAGFMVDPDTAPLDTANAGTVTMRTASAFGTAARIGSGLTIPDPGGTPNVAFTVSSSAMAEKFENGQTVRVLRPPNQGNLFESAGNPNGNLTIAVPPSGTTITLTGFAASDEGTDVLPGDIIVRTNASANNPNTVTYQRSGGDLQRVTDIGVVGAVDTQVVASKLQDAAVGLAFSYILEDGTETATPGTLNDVVAVRVTLTGQTAATLEGVKTRSLTNVIKIRN